MKKLLLAVIVLCLAIPVLVHAQTSDIGFGWSAPAAQNPPVPVTGYKFYMSQASGQYTYGTPAATFAVPGTAAAPATLTVPADGVKRYFVVTAYNANGESGPSNEVSATPPDKRIPGAPGNLNIVLQFALQADGTLTLSRMYVEKPSTY